MHALIAQTQKMPRSCATVISFPCSPRLMVRFWQNTHRRLQPEKNTAPLPRVPEMHGSSPKCGAARATTGASGTAQKPNCPPARSTPQPRGQMEQSCVIMPPAHGVLREIYGFCGYYKVFSSISQPSSACFMKSSEIQCVPVVALFKREIAKKAASG
ncbi:MAG: hypothetical protein ACLRXG_03620 [Oscillospiraceae bacterium]